MDKSDQKTKHDDFHLETVNENELEEIKAWSVESTTFSASKEYSN